MDKATSLSVLIVVALVEVSIILAIVQQQQTSGQTRTVIKCTTDRGVNFAQLFEQKFGATSHLDAPVVGPTTVILQGHAKI
jgi:hypothetical protein